jgi:acyl-CoA reductase-like NAD-dependent aldehyde dehydrogenase
MGFMDMRKMTKKELKQVMHEIAGTLDMNYHDLIDLVKIVTGKEKLRDMTRADVMKTIRVMKNIQEYEETHPETSYFIAPTGVIVPLKKRTLEELKAEFNRLEKMLRGL